MKIFIALLSIFCFSTTLANDNEAADADANNLIIDEMPTDYLEFANVIGLLKPEEIVGLIGEPSKKLDLKIIFKKLYALGSRNILIEGGNELTTYLVKKRLFNKFYLFKSKKILSKMVEYKEFTALRNPKKNYKKRLNLKLDFGKDLITLYKN